MAIQAPPALTYGVSSDGTVTPANVSFAFNNITTKTTTVVKSGAGILHSVTVNTKGSGSNTGVIYDNTAGSGTVIASIDPTAAVGTLVYDLAFATGLTIVTATGTQADLTITYR